MIRIMFQIDLGSHEGPFVIGPVIPPNHLFADARAEDIYGYWQAVVSPLWEEWREVEPEPDTDDEFCEWLVREKEWQIPDEETITVNLD